MKRIVEASATLPADRFAARIVAHALIEQIQSAPRPDLVDRFADQAVAAGWSEVEVLLRHSQVLHSSLQGRPADEVRANCDAMRQAAEAFGDEILIALALASRALFLDDGDAATGEDLGGGLARAVAILEQIADSEPDELGLRALELPNAFVECGNVYHQQGLWELEDEMYQRACDALTRPLPESARHVGDHTRRVLVVNRLEGVTTLVSALIEVGQRDRARAVARDATRPSPAERAELPPAWAIEMRALEYFLDAVVDSTAGGDEGGELWDALAESTWHGYRACILLADAVRAADAGDVARSVEVATRAAGLLGDHRSSITTLAWYLAAQSASEESAAAGYARRLAGLRWQDRLGMLAAARARLTAERVLRESEQLSRQALADGLTGLANRHAETRFVARLRGRGEQNRLAVVLLDVDHFKSVNDTFGHAVGDKVLQVIGAVLQAAVRTSTDLAVRRGGDEFMLLVDLSGRPEVSFRVDDVVRAVADHDWNAVAPGLRVSVSAGHASGAANRVDELTEAADEQLYRAKAAGRGRALG
ncbi:GGDEF domain-containing protein [Cryptosporangium japonicum]|uniref:GGDEF domain-containing protein n=1 Tax=Cryptosporangium japonicum TaxID=80872 RepID=A0ABN0V8G4_9ACTN